MFFKNLFIKDLEITEENLICRFVEKENLRKAIYQYKHKVNHLKSRRMSKVEKREIVREVLSHTQFTEVVHFYIRHHSKFYRKMQLKFENI